MKALKIFFTVIACLLILFLIVSALLPSVCKVERSILIDGPSYVVFDNVNNLERWKNWSYWQNLDTAQTVTYNEIASGAGSSYSWDGKKTKKGALTIIESIPPQKIKIDLDFKEQGTAQSEWTFEQTDSGTIVTQAFTSELGFLERIMPGLMMEKFMGKAFEQDLSNLKMFSESTPILNGPVLEQVVVKPQWVITLRDTTSINNISGTLGTLYGTLMQYIKDNNLTYQSYPLAIWHKFDMTPDFVDVEAGVPVTDSVALAPGMRLMKTGGMAVKATHWGAYDKSAATYEAITAYMKENGLTATGAAWEVYVTDPVAEKDTSKWQTDIFFPI